MLVLLEPIGKALGFSFTPVERGWTLNQKFKNKQEHVIINCEQRECLEAKKK